MTEEQKKELPALGVHCQCGCGLKVKNGRKYRKGHWAKTKAGRDRISEIKYQGARSNHGDGYITIKVDGKNKLEHVHVAEQILGRPLPLGAVVHHIDRNRSNNIPSNLVICPDNGYHLMIHRRERAYDECGHADWRKCTFCGQYDDPVNLYIPPSGSGIEHRRCGREYRRNYYRQRG